jgi:hypothetical protein
VLAHRVGLTPVHGPDGQARRADDPTGRRERLLARLMGTFEIGARRCDELGKLCGQFADERRIANAGSAAPVWGRKRTFISRSAAALRMRTSMAT